MVTKCDLELNETIARVKQNLKSLVHMLPNGGERLRAISDQELNETIARIKNNLKLCGKFLSGGGERLWANLKRHEDELQRRRKRQLLQTEDLEMAVKTDCDLNETIARIKNSFKLCGMLRDGGERLGIYLKPYEDELERRQFLEELDPCAKDATLYYPSRDDPDAVEVKHADMGCLAPEAYISSTIMNFYIRYLQQPKSSSESTTCNYHFFSTYFYNKLEKLKYEEDSFRKFRKWWKDVSIFEKAYILLPVHESAHWSLVIICFPNKEDEQGPILLHLDSLGLHNSKLLCDNIKRFLKEEWSYLRKSGTPLDLPISDEIWENLESEMEHKRVTVPQQKNEYDCGLFVLLYMERFIKQAPERMKIKDLSMFGRQWFRPREASNLRSTICNLLVEEFRKVKEKESTPSSQEDGDDRPPEFVITSYKKPKESSENSYQTEDLEMVTKSDRELNETIARIKQSLKQHEDERERRLKRQLLNKADNECEETIQVSDSDDGVSRGKKQGDRKSLSSLSFAKLFIKTLDKSCNGRSGKPNNQVAGKGRSRMAVSSSSQEPSRSPKSGLVDSEKQITSNDDKSTSSFSVPNSPQVPPSSNLGPRTRPNYNLVDKDPPVQTTAQFMEELDPCVELLLGLRKPWNDTKTSSKDANC